MLATVIAPQAAGNFLVKLADSERTVIARIANKTGKRHVRMTAGDRVMIEMSPYDLNKARIIFRYRWAITRRRTDNRSTGVNNHAQ